MPSDRGTSYACDRCGVEGFRSFDDARSHESSCQGYRYPPPPHHGHYLSPHAHAHGHGPNVPHPHQYPPQAQPQYHAHAGPVAVTGAGANAGTRPDSAGGVGIDIDEDPAVLAGVAGNLSAMKKRGRPSETPDDTPEGGDEIHGHDKGDGGLGSTEDDYGDGSSPELRRRKLDHAFAKPADGGFGKPKPGFYDVPQQSLQQQTPLTPTPLLPSPQNSVNSAKENEQQNEQEESTSAQEQGMPKGNASDACAPVVPSTNLSDLDSLTCQNVEAFQATEEDVAKFDPNSAAGDSVARPIVVGQVGFRCAHCCRPGSTASSPSAIMYPGSVGTISESMRLMADQHFVACTALPSSVKDAMDEARRKKEEEDCKMGQGAGGGGANDEWRRIAFIEFCVEFCGKVGISNRNPARSGLQYGGPDSAGGGPGNSGGGTTDTSARPTVAEDRPNANVALGQLPANVTPVVPKKDRPPLGEVQGQGQGGGGSRDGGVGSKQGQEDPFSGGQQTPGGPAPSGGGGVKGPGGSNPADNHQPIPQPPPPPPNDSSAAAAPQANYGTAATSTGSGAGLPPSHPDYPFFQDPYGAWVCRYCCSVPYHYRAPQSVWQAQDRCPPSPDFLETHLRSCRGGPYGPPPPMPQPAHGAPPQGMYGHSQGQPPSHHQQEAPHTPHTSHQGGGGQHRGGGGAGTGAAMGSDTPSNAQEGATAQYGGMWGTPHQGGPPVGGPETPLSQYNAHGGSPRMPALGGQHGPGGHGAAAGGGEGGPYGAAPPPYYSHPYGAPPPPHHMPMPPLGGEYAPPPHQGAHHGPGHPAAPAPHHMMPGHHPGHPGRPSSGHGPPPSAPGGHHMQPAPPPAGPGRGPGPSGVPPIEGTGTDAANQAATRYLTDSEARIRNSLPLHGPDAAVHAVDLVLGEDKLLLTDYFFHLMKQLRLCRFSEADRKTRGGKRENVALGYGGLQCVHCADAPNSRKFFWSNVDRLANSFAEIPGHVLKCRRCPAQIKSALLELKLRHPDQMSRLPRGSQKVFFRRMWRRIHDDDPVKGDSNSNAGSQQNARQAKAGQGQAKKAKAGQGATSTVTPAAQSVKAEEKSKDEAAPGAPISSSAGRSNKNEASTAAFTDNSVPTSIEESASRTLASLEGVMRTPIAPRASRSDIVAATRPSPVMGPHEPVGGGGTLVVSGTTEAAARALAASASTPHNAGYNVASGSDLEGPPIVMLAIKEDAEWLSDTDCFVRRNIEVFTATRQDVETAQSDRKYPINIGQVGIRCIHCAVSLGEHGEVGCGARGSAVSFPYSISGVYESVREFQRLHLESCPNLPPDTKAKLKGMKGSASLSSVLRRYYVMAAKALGMFDTAEGIRAGGESVALGSSAEYEFTAAGGTGGVGGHGPPHGRIPHGHVLQGHGSGAPTPVPEHMRMGYHGATPSATPSSHHVSLPQYGHGHGQTIGHAQQGYPGMAGSFLESAITPLESRKRKAPRPTPGTEEESARKRAHVDVPNVEGV